MTRTARKRQVKRLKETRDVHSGQPAPLSLEGVLPLDMVRAAVPPEPAVVKSDPVAHAEWQRVVPLLLSLGVCTERDQSLLGTYCLLLSTYQRLHVWLEKNGFSYKMETGQYKGRMVKRPEVSVYLTALDYIVQFSRSYG